MARFRNLKDIENFYAKQRLLTDKFTPYPLAVSLRTGGKPSGGYLSKLHRQTKKTGSQLKGLPGCGQKVNDWLLGY